MDENCSGENIFCCYRFHGQRMNRFLFIAALVAMFFSGFFPSHAHAALPQFTLEDQTKVPLNALITSNTITVTGITGTVPVIITGIGSDYQINNGPWTRARTYVGNMGTVRVRLRSSSMFLTTTSARLTIGTVSDTFSVTTISDNVPDPFSVPDQTSVEPGTLITSNSVTVGGFAIPVSVTITNGE